MTTTYFAPSRPDGRSDARVIYDLVTGAEPGAEFGYQQLTDALAAGLGQPIARQRVYRAVTAGNRLLQKEDRRMLGVVRGRGYRVLHADDHLPMALGRQTRAETQLMLGVRTLQSVREEELSPEVRTVHRGYTHILSGLYQMHRHQERRVSRHEAAIDEIRRRVDQLEVKSA